jgi:hypothetical protein
MLKMHKDQVIAPLDKCVVECDWSTAARMRVGQTVCASGPGAAESRHLIRPTIQARYVSGTERRLIGELKGHFNDRSNIVRR